MMLHSPTLATAILILITVTFNTKCISANQLNPSQNVCDITRGGSNTISADNTENLEKDEMEGIFTITPEQRQNILLSSSTDDFVSSELASKIKQFYDTQGYVLIRGLIDPNMLRRLQHAGDAVIKETKTNAAVSSFTSIQFGAVFSSPPSLGNNNDEKNDKAAFREVALESAVPTFISRILLQLEDNSSSGSKTNANAASNNNLRVLNDVFLAKTGKEETFCGWHVDDLIFWPCSAHQHPNTPVGVNAWIAMDDIPAKTYGGGMAIIPKSHLPNCEWRARGYKAIGSTPTFQAKGYSSIKKFAQEVSINTCDLPKLDPELNEKLEQMKKVFDYQQGDVLLCSRWLWHRSMQLGEKGHKKMSSLFGNTTFKRYTVRYECGNTRLLSGISLQQSVTYDPSNAGQTLNHVVSSTKLPFFPQAWPRALESEYCRMEEMVTDVFPKIAEKQQEQKRELFELLRSKRQADKEEGGE